MEVRRSALERLGSLSARHNADKKAYPNRLKTYYERQARLNDKGPLSRRQIDAFLGLCTSCTVATDKSCSSDYILKGLQTILSRWHYSTHTAQSSQQLNGYLRSIAAAAFSAAIHVSGDSTANPESAFNFLYELISVVESQDHGEQ